VTSRPPATQRRARIVWSKTGRGPYADAAGHRGLLYVRQQRRFDAYTLKTGDEICSRVCRIRAAA
jgi:hypothetical protein